MSGAVFPAGYQHKSIADQSDARDQAIDQCQNQQPEQNTGFLLLLDSVIRGSFHRLTTRRSPILVWAGRQCDLGIIRDFLRNQ